MNDSKKQCLHFCQRNWLAQLVGSLSQHFITLNGSGELACCLFSKKKLKSCSSPYGQCPQPRRILHLWKVLQERHCPAQTWLSIKIEEDYFLESVKRERNNTSSYGTESDLQGTPNHEESSAKPPSALWTGTLWNVKGVGILNFWMRFHLRGFLHFLHDSILLYVLLEFDLRYLEHLQQNTE